MADDDMADDKAGEENSRTPGVAAGMAIAAGAAIGALAVAAESFPTSPSAGDAPPTPGNQPTGPDAGGEPSPGAGTPPLQRRSVRTGTAGTGSGGARLTGMGAVAGLGVAAAVGLATAGHKGTGAPGHAHPGTGGATAPISAGDQGTVPPQPGTDLPVSGTHGLASGPGGGPPGVGTTPGSTFGHTGAAPAPQSAAPVVPSQGSTSPATYGSTPGVHGKAAAGNPSVAGGVGRHAAQGTATTNSVHVARHGARHGQSSTAPGNVRPDSSAKPTSWTQGTPPAHTGSQQAGGQTSSGAQQQGAQTWVTVPMTDAEIAAMMREKTPQERQALIEQTLADQGLLTKDGSKNWLPLPAGFYNKDGYSYTDDTGKKYDLSTLGAAATVAMLSDAFAHFKADILALSNTAGSLRPKADLIHNEAIPLAQAFNKVDDMWGKVAGIIGNSQDPNVTQAQGNFRQLKNSLFGGAVDDPKSRTCGTTDGGVAITAKALDDQMISLYETASAYVEEEEKNLSQFGVHADDPRPAWERARFVTTPDNKSLDLAQNQAFPPGYFDPNNPKSPYYQPTH